ncbi:MAG: GlsB/YeaQ/YmgE family stress response membrane protein [Chloroflexota bacterium]
MECIYLVIMVLALAAVGWVIDLVIPGKMPYGWIGGVVAAIIGGLIGGALLGNFGPAVTWNGYTLSFIPAIIGGIILAVIVRFVMGMMGKRTT